MHGFVSGHKYKCLDLSYRYRLSSVSQPIICCC